MIIDSKKICRLFGAALMALTAMTATSCKDSESYSDLLREEEKAVNWYLAAQRVETEVPADGNFEIGENAPFYRMDEDGTVYMQVINKGDMDNRPVADDKVFFRFSRKNIKLLYETGSAFEVGNIHDFNSSLGATYFFYENRTYPNSTTYGTGIQLPLKYLGYNSEVNLVLKSYSGFSVDQSQCIPYIIKVKYYKPEN